MIAFNNNIYRTINDKFYLGNKQIGKVYLGTTLIYPEQTQEQENVVDGHKLEGIRLGGNVYDTGIAPTKNTTVEICFENKQDTIGPNGFPVFGTHHDIYTADTVNGSTNCHYNSTADNNNWKTKVNDKYKSHTGWYTQWRGFTNFHLIIKRDANNNDYAYVRYGGPAVQQNYVETSGQKYSLHTIGGRSWGEALISEFYDTTKSDNIISLGKNYFNNTITKKAQKGNKEYSLNGKFFVLRIEPTGRTKTVQINGYKMNDDRETATNYQWNFTCEEARIYLGQGVGIEYYESNDLYESNKNQIATAGFLYNETTQGGNLWIGSLNRNFSCTTDAVVSNKIRNNVPPNTSLSSAADFVNDCDDLDTNLFKSGDLEWVYVIIKQSDNERYLFIPEKTGVIESGNDYYIIFKRYPWDSINRKFSTTHDKIVLPFMKCSINND